jgi:nucleotide-binding universal stress UspA family protein
MTLETRRLLVPIDFSTASNTAIDYATLASGSWAASVHLVHVIEDSFLAHAQWDIYAPDVSAWRRDAVRANQARLEAIAAGFRRTSARVTIEVPSGRPAREILAAANRRGVDLIVMGTHGRTGPSHTVYGSVTGEVVRMAPCAVLAVCEQRIDYIPAVQSLSSLRVL